MADLAAWFEESRHPAMIVGGVAASILGRPRATRDIDSLVVAPEHHWPELLATARRHGMTERVEDPLEFARRTHVLLLRHVESGIDMDVILGRLPFEADAVARAREHKLGHQTVRLPQVEDLMIMKAVAQRPRDLSDIEGLLDANPEADIVRVRQWVREFSMAAGMPDMLEGFDRLLTRRKAGGVS